MRIVKSNRRGQSTAEYAVVIALVLGAVIGMQTYVKRAINARIQEGADRVLPTTLGVRRQFEPGYATSDVTTLSTVTTGAGGVVLTGKEGKVSDVTAADGFVSKTARDAGSVQAETQVTAPTRGR